jgi:hypothetical protein
VSDTGEESWLKEAWNVSKMLGILFIAMLLFGLGLDSYHATPKQSLCGMAAFFAIYLASLGLIQYRRNRQDT